MLSPFALVREVRRFFSGPIALSGAITDGAGVLAAEAIGADFAYIGTRFIATSEANAVEPYKQMILDSSAADIVYTPFFSGVHGNYLKGSVAAGLDLPACPLPTSSRLRLQPAARRGKTSGARVKGGEYRRCASDAPGSRRLCRNTDAKGRLRIG
jgi:nitronate monooxygenase